MCWLTIRADLPPDGIDQDRWQRHAGRGIRQRRRQFQHHRRLDPEQLPSHRKRRHRSRRPVHPVGHRRSQRIRVALQRRGRRHPNVLDITSKSGINDYGISEDNFPGNVSTVYHSTATSVATEENQPYDALLSYDSNVQKVEIDGSSSGSVDNVTVQVVNSSPTQYWLNAAAGQGSTLKIDATGTTLAQDYAIGDILPAGYNPASSQIFDVAGNVSTTTLAWNVANPQPIPASPGNPSGVPTALPSSVPQKFSVNDLALLQYFGGTGGGVVINNTAQATPPTPPTRCWSGPPAPPATSPRSSAVKVPRMSYWAVTARRNFSAGERSTTCWPTIRSTTTQAARRHYSCEPKWDAGGNAPSERELHLPLSDAGRLFPGPRHFSHRRRQRDLAVGFRTQSDDDGVVAGRLLDAGAKSWQRPRPPRCCGGCRWARMRPRTRRRDTGAPCMHGRRRIGGPSQTGPNPRLMAHQGPGLLVPTRLERPIDAEVGTDPRLEYAALRCWQQAAVRPLAPAVAAG